MTASMHPYTQALLSSIPRPNAERGRQRTILKGEVPDPANPPFGCAFHTRCPNAMGSAGPSSALPSFLRREDDGAERVTACHLYPMAS